MAEAAGSAGGGGGGGGGGAWLGEAGESASPAVEGVPRLKEAASRVTSSGNNVEDPARIFRSGGDAGVLAVGVDFDDQNPKKPVRLFCSCCSGSGLVFPEFDPSRFARSPHAVLFIGLDELLALIESDSED
jgi:hypothetical protein